MQEATCTLKSPAVHHGWALPSTPEADTRPEKGSSVSPVEAQERQQSEAGLNAVVSSLGRLALSSTDTSPSAVPVSVVTSVSSSGYPAWPPVDGDLQSSGLLCTTSAAGLQNTSMVSGAVGANGLRSPFSSSTSHLLQQQNVPRRAITGHASIPVPPDGFGAVPSTAASRPAWNSQAQAINWLQATRPGPLPTRFGSVHHGRSMSVQNINMTGNSSIQSRKSSSSQYGNGMFGTVPSVSGYTGQSRSPYFPQLDPMGLRFSDIDEKSVLGGLNQVRHFECSSKQASYWVQFLKSVLSVHTVAYITWQSFAGCQADYLLVYLENLDEERKLSANLQVREKLWFLVGYCVFLILDCRGNTEYSSKHCNTVSVGTLEHCKWPKSQLEDFIATGKWFGHPANEVIL